MADQDLTIYNGMMIPKSIVGKLKAEENRLKDVHSIYADPVINTYAATTSFPAAADAYPIVNGSYIQALFTPSNYDSSSTRRGNGCENGLGDGNCEGSEDCPDSSEVGGGNQTPKSTIPPAPAAPPANPPKALDCAGSDKETKECKDKVPPLPANPPKTDCKDVANKDKEECKDKSSTPPPADNKTAKDCVDKDLKLTDRNGITASEASSDVKIIVEKDQWISKATKAVYGIGDNSPEAHKLYDAIAKINNITDPKQWLTYDAAHKQELVLPRIIKIGETEYKSSCDKKDEDLKAEAEKNRTTIGFGGNVKPENKGKKKKHGGETPSPATQQNPPSSSQKNVPELLRLNNPATDCTSVAQNPSSSKYPDGTYPNDEWFFPTKMWHAFKTAVNAGDLIYHTGGINPYLDNKIDGHIDAGVTRALNNPVNQDLILNGVSDAAQRNSGAVKKLAGAGAPAILDEFNSDANAPKVTALLQRYTPIELGELAKHKDKMLPIAEAMIKDPRSQQIFASIVKDNSNQISGDVVAALTKNKEAFKDLFKGMVTAATDSSNSELADSLADMAFGLLLKTAKKPEKFNELRQTTQKLSDSVSFSSHFKPF